MESEVIIYGKFDGSNMVGEDKKCYPVPQNYASKSRLLEGDGLKLIITKGGEFIYKQIEPVERRRVMAKVCIIDEKLFVACGEDTYRVLQAT